MNICDYYDHPILSSLWKPISHRLNSCICSTYLTQSS